MGIIVLVVVLKGWLTVVQVVRISFQMLIIAALVAMHVQVHLLVLLVSVRGKLVFLVFKGQIVRMDFAIKIVGFALMVRMARGAHMGHLVEVGIVSGVSVVMARTARGVFLEKGAKVDIVLISIAVPRQVL